jgi:hypothetical protein
MTVTLAPSTKAALERNGSVVTVDKQESLAAVSKGSFRAGLLRATQSTEDLVLWASAAALRAQREVVNSANSEQGAVMRAQTDQVLLKRRADSIRLNC